MRRRARPGGGRQIEITIDTLGGRGDGVARHDGRPVFVAGALPGDRLLARVTGARAGGFKAQIVELLEEGPGHVTPPCPHFGPCGGCTLQHFQEAQYLAWKRDQVVQALARRRLDTAVVGPLVRVPDQSRRRVSMAAQRQAGRLYLGFHERESKVVVDAPECLIVVSELARLLDPLRQVLEPLVPARGFIGVEMTWTKAGADLLLTLAEAPDLGAREALAAFAKQADLARLCWTQEGEAPELLAQHREPALKFGDVPVTPPPGGFVQPTAEGEAALTEAVLAFLPEGAARVADLFAGCGTFSFPIAKRARVHAVEGDEAALAALRNAAQRHGLDGRIDAEVRDLARRPLGAESLNAYDCVLFDPPRSGAKEQAERLAGSQVPTVIAVSCSANSFARDAALLVEGGYRLEAVTPVDQFVWSGHVELVARFLR